ncbi:GntR family transcriptional regulator [Exiguobacterium sp. S22-S28]|uniref:GntR family transcriptional regulator n=1 Tax=Exiguobacterium sp. S22-S28 TaxID=3342768 RepID=UPI00372D431C
METNQSLHSYIKEELLDRIKSGLYQAGQQLPTEYELCEDFDVSRTTVRAALNQLTLEGYLIRQQGKGTFVADQKVRQTLSDTPDTYTEQLAVQGKRGHVAAVDLTVVPANAAIVAKLHVSLSDPIQRIERIRRANDEPTQYEISYIPWHIAPGITKKQAEHSLYTTLRETFAISVAKTTESLEITLADERISAHLDCELGMPCFYIETVAENKDGEPIEYSRSYFRGDKTNFVIERHYAAGDAL